MQVMQVIQVIQKIQVIQVKQVLRVMQKMKVKQVILCSNAGTPNKLSNVNDASKSSASVSRL